MKLIWHIIRKDLVQFRWALLAWMLLYAGQIGLGFFALQADNPETEWVEWLQQGNGLLVFLQFATGYVLVTQLVQADELAGTRMFWLTRPVSARRLLAAKALGVLVVFAVLPVLWLLPWWCYCHFSPHNLLWTAAETLGWQLLMIAPAFLIASFTDDLGRALMWTLLLITGLFAGSVWMQSELKLALGTSVPSANSGLIFSRMWLIAVILLVGAPVVIVHQFLTRRFIRSLILTIPLLGLMVLTGRFWPWDCTMLFAEINQTETPPSAAGGALAGVQVTFGSAEIPDPERFSASKGTWLKETLEVQGLPEGMGLDVRSAQTWRWPGDPVGEAKNIRFYSYSDVAVRKLLALPPWQDDAETVRWQQARQEKINADRVARGLKPMPGYLPRGLRPTGVLTAYTLMPDALMTRIQAQPPASEMHLQCEVSRGQILFEMPLQADAVGSGDSQTYRFTSVFHPHASEHATARVVLSRPTLLVNGIWWTVGINPTGRDALPQPLATVNRMEGNYGSANLGYHEGAPLKAQIGGVDIRWVQLGVSARSVIREGEWAPHDPDWFSHTTVVLVRGEPVARFTREVKTEKFELQPQASEKAPADKSF